MVHGSVVGVHGALEGGRFTPGIRPMTFGRDESNDVVLQTELASRLHAELRYEGDAVVLEDRGSRNGTWVNGSRVTVVRLNSGDEIVMGDEVFGFETTGPQATVFVASQQPAAERVLRVVVTGGGPVGLGFALILEDLLGPRVDIRVYDGRWTQAGRQVVWKTLDQGNFRRQQVVTVQSRQYSRLPLEVQERLFAAGSYSEMWPQGPDSVEGLGPRNIRIAYIEDELLALANEKPEHIRLVPEIFDAASQQDDVAAHDVLAICEGSRSQTVQYFAHKFGTADPSVYALDGKHVQDLVLGLRVKSTLTDPMSVLLTVAQNRFLLNSSHGDGFLNMRLTDQEAQEAVGIDPTNRVFTPCIQSEPCVLELTEKHEFHCAVHHAVFLPAVLKGSTLWTRIQEGLQLYGVAPEDLTSVTGFRLDMVQRPRFTAQLYAKTANTPGTFGFLLGDTANAIHFWPGRGLNSGLASAISLARCLSAAWRGTTLRDADFLRHEAVMAMLQYRHKARAWRQMVTTDSVGNVRAIKDQIALGIAEGDQGTYDRKSDLDDLTKRLHQIRGRLRPRIDGLPDDATLRTHLEQLPGHTLHTLLVSEPWDTSNVGGEEVDVEWLLKLAASADSV
jgi:hypothetical protein